MSTGLRQWWDGILFKNRVTLLPARLPTSGIGVTQNYHAIASTVATGLSFAGLFLLPEAFLGKMIENRPPIIPPCYLFCNMLSKNACGRRNNQNKK